LDESFLRASQHASVIGHRTILEYGTRPTSVFVWPAFLDSVLRRAHSALSLNTPTDLRNGWFPEQTTVDMRESDEAEGRRRRNEEREREKSSLDPEGLEKSTREGELRVFRRLVPFCPEIIAPRSPKCGERFPAIASSNPTITPDGREHHARVTRDHERVLRGYTRVGLFDFYHVVVSSSDRLASPHSWWDRSADWFYPRLLKGAKRRVDPYARTGL